MMVNIVLIIIICILLLFIFISYRKLNKISDILDDILEDNFNQRIRIQNKIKPINILIVKINKIIEKLQQINKKSIINEEARKKMISNISHDLRTPLTSMLGYMELIFEDDSLSDEKKNDIKYIS